MLTYRYDLDMVPGGVPVIVNVSQYDNAFSIEFHLYSRTGSLDLSDVDSAAIRGKKLDGHAYSADAAYDNGVVTVTGHVQMTAISGKQTFEITLYDYVENELNSANFILNVEDAPMDQDDIESDSVIRELINVTSRADKIIKAASDAEAWAVGQRDGVDVDTDDEAYHNPGHPPPGYEPVFPPAEDRNRRHGIRPGPDQIRLRHGCQPSQAGI